MNNKIPYKLLNDFVFRAPIFPVNSSDYNKMINDSIFKEALYLASSEFYNLTYIDHPISLTNLTPRIKHSLLKYISRITTRCTPFGLFAGCGTGKIGDFSDIQFGQSNCKSKTRLDMSVLFSIWEESSKTKESQSKMLFKPNDSLLRIYPFFFRYIEYKHSNNIRRYFLSEIDYEDYLENILIASKSGCSAIDLIMLLVEDGFTEKESAVYIENLISNQILIPEKESFATSNLEPIDVIIDKLQVSRDYKNQTQLKSIKSSLVELDNNTIGRGIHPYKELEQKFQDGIFDSNSKYLFQSDLSIYAERSFLRSEIYSTAIEGLTFLNKITPKTNIPSLDKFKKDFLRRYEDQEIPLLEALDVDLGIGFGEINMGEVSLNPLLKDITIGQDFNTRLTVKTLPEILLEKHLICQKKYKEEIEITDEDIMGLGVNWEDLPNTMFSLIEVVKAGNGDHPPKIIMNAVNGSSAANLLSRFCHANKEIYEIVKQIVEVEEKLLPKGYVMAEIVHLPQSRLGNIIHRPILRNYELPYLTNSLQQEEAIIDVSDILVSIKNGRDIVLTSKKLNVVILPILTSAHNFKVDSLPIYNFLCSIQSQNKRNNLSFRLPTSKEETTYFPRMVYKNIILSRATWIIMKKETEKLNSDRLTEFVEQYRLPKKVYICAGDNKLYIDFDNQDLLSLFLSEAKNRNLILEEYLFDHEDMLIKNDNEIYTNQIILSFVKNAN